MTDTSLETGPAKHLEALRVEIRKWVPLAAVSLIQPRTPEDEPHLQLAYRHQDGRITCSAENVYRWAATGETIGHTDHASAAARAVAGKIGAPLARSI
jgi:hypothetical protein